MTAREKTAALPLLVLLALSCLVLAPTLIYPYGRDQGIFGYAGHAVLRGGVPFRDFWDPKPPALYYVYALAELLFGYSMFSIRLLDLAWQAATAGILFGVTRRLSGNTVASFAAGLLYVLAYASRGWWNTAQPDDFLNLPLALAALILMRALKRERSACLSMVVGALTAVAFYFKYPMGAMLAVFMAVALMKRGVCAAALAECACMATGFALVAGGYALYLVGAGAWGEFLYAEFFWARQYAGVGENRGGLLHVRDVLGSHFSFVALAILALAGGGPALVRRRDPFAAMIALWALVCTLNLYLQNKFYIYHFAPLAAPLAVAASFAAAAPFERKVPPLRRRAALLVIAFALFVPLLAVNRRYNVYCLEVYRDSARAIAGRLLSGKGLYRYYMNARFTSDDFSLPAGMAVAGFLARNTAPDETSFIWGYETIVYYLARRESPSRFVHNFPLRCEWVPRRFGDELLGALARARPKYILLVRNDPAWWVTGTREDSLQALRSYPRLEAFIANNYIFDRSIEDFFIYRLK